MAKKINFEGVRLIAGGGRMDPRTEAYVLRQWLIILADGTRYQVDLYVRPGADSKLPRVWQKMCKPKPSSYMQPHWRKAARAEGEQLEIWLTSHPEYQPDHPMSRARGESNA